MVRPSLTSSPLCFAGNGQRIAEERTSCTLIGQITTVQLASRARSIAADGRREVKQAFGQSERASHQLNGGREETLRQPRTPADARPDKRAKATGILVRSVNKPVVVPAAVAVEVAPAREL